MKVVASFHGGLAGVDATRGSTKAALLVCHGGADQFVSDDDIKHFKGNLDSMKVFYQMIVYPGATHAFTNPEATANGKKFNMPIEYNAASDKKSWSDMNFFLKRSFK
jgi:dienelactone hydrolase